MRKIINFHDILSGFFWLALSLTVCIESLWGEIGSLSSPGAGFLPFWSGVTLGICSIILIVKSRLSKKLDMEMICLWKEMRWATVLRVLCSLFLYTFFLPIIGYLISTFLLMTYHLGIMTRPRFWVRGIIAFFIVLSSYVIFYYLLDIKLPKGIFGF